MREIKFRAYDKVLNKYLFDGKSFHVLGETMLFDMIGQYLHENGRDSLLGINDIILEQYTSYKDRNMKEVYEGDVLKVFAGVTDDLTLSLLVVFDKYGFGLETHDPSGRRAVWRLNVYDTEVIGNINENPELLE